MGSSGNCRCESSYFIIFYRLLIEFWPRRTYDEVIMSSAREKFLSFISDFFVFNKKILISDYGIDES
jgi:hypothetical protein